MEQFRFITRPLIDGIFAAYCWTQNVLISFSLGTLNDPIEKVIHLKIFDIEIKCSTFRVFLGVPKILEAFNVLCACISHLSRNCRKLHSTYIRSFDKFVNILCAKTLSNSSLLSRMNALNVFLYMAILESHFSHP